uniref:Uncharacterized protein n=1 Tax=Anopheles albimanus TaxID=7167 RepID=A0A182FFP8_ANOAL
MQSVTGSKCLQEADSRFDYAKQSSSLSFLLSRTRTVVPRHGINGYEQDLRTAFDLLDRDQDGHVTPEELQFMLRNLGIHVRDELIDDLLREASRTVFSGKL